MSVFSVTFLLSIYYGLVFNYAWYLSLFSSTPHAFFNLSLLSLPLIITLLINCLFNFFNWNYLFKPFFIVLTLFSSITFYVAHQFGIMFNEEMFDIIFASNVQETSAFINFMSVVWVIIFGVLPALLLWRVTVKYPVSIQQGIVKRTLFVLGSFTLAIGLFAINFNELTSLPKFNRLAGGRIFIPFNPLFTFYDYMEKITIQNFRPYKQLGLDAKVISAHDGVKQKPTLLVLVIGETARSQSYSLNGYARPTNQYTQGLGVISFQDVTACGTFTHISLPCLFSNLTHQNFNEIVAKRQDGLLDILQHAGLSLLWRENDGGCQSVCDRIPYQSIYPSYDPDLIKNIMPTIKKTPRDSVVVLHMAGSHAEYFQRYPLDHRYFKPDCRHKGFFGSIPHCTSDEIINSYDNTILYTDYVLSLLIKTLSQQHKNYNTAFIYISDHGESLGEYGLYLHGMPYRFAPDYQKKVPMILWVSPGFVKSKKLNKLCLEQKALHDSFSHDNFFHSVLGILDVQTREYNPKLDLFLDCRKL